jgi:UDP-N-acetylmuramoyl-tripeptide--D-alanyl-D-alanine ligase
MIEWTVEEMVHVTKGQLIQGSYKKTVCGLSIDTRKIQKNELFIPLIGKRRDGHDFIEDAVRSGAAAIIVSQWRDEQFAQYKNLCVIKVRDTLQALHDLARYYISKFNIPIIAVTGSTGKTTTKEMIYSVLSKKYKVLKNEGNFNNHIGLPLTVFQLKPEHEIAIFEMGMSGFGEIDKLASIVRPNIGVITNIGLSHIEHLQSQQNIFKAKMEITNYFKNTDCLIVNGDDPHLAALKNSHTDYSIYFIGLSKPCDYQGIHIDDQEVTKTTFEVVLNKKVYQFILKVPGRHNIYNALCAISVGRMLGVEPELMVEGIKDFKSHTMRLNILTTSQNIKMINDVYNASPDSMKSALDVFNKIQARRKIAILGDMLEMGSYSIEGHLALGCEVAKQSIDILITVGKEAKNIAHGAIKNGLDQQKVFSCLNNQQVIDFLENILQEEDAVLVKGSRGMKMEEIADYIQERSTINDTV